MRVPLLHPESLLCCGNRDHPAVKVSWPYFNQVVCALRFFYRQVLTTDWAVAQIPYQRPGRRLPEILRRRRDARKSPLHYVKGRAIRGRSGDGELVLRLRSSVPMRLENGAAVAEFTLGADTSAWFVLEMVLAQERSPSEEPDYERDAFKQTVKFWRRWVARNTYGGRWREMGGLILA